MRYGRNYSADWRHQPRNCPHIWTRDETSTRPGAQRCTLCKQLRIDPKHTIQPAERDQ